MLERRLDGAFFRDYIRYFRKMYKKNDVLSMRCKINIPAISKNAFKLATEYKSILLFLMIHIFVCSIWNSLKLRIGFLKENYKSNTIFGTKSSIYLSRSLVLFMGEIESHLKNSAITFSWFHFIWLSIFVILAFLSSFNNSSLIFC